jgi:hypothetical protein
VCFVDFMKRNGVDTTHVPLGRLIMEYPIPLTLLHVLNDEHAREWSSGPVRGHEHQMVRWIELAELPPSKLIIGLSDSGSWVRGGATVDLGRRPPGPPQIQA